MNAPTHYSIGDEIDFFCKKCRLNLHGNVAALHGDAVAKVTCRTCRSTQPYFPERGEEELRAGLLKRAFRIRDRRQQQWTDTEKARTVAAESPDVTRRWREATENVNANYARKYSEVGSFKEGEVIVHGTHGLGIVVRVLHEQGILALFRKAELPLPMNLPTTEGEK
ncbi:MAG: hypothetical protein FJ109_19160 [Deltaproteobacteria bacterium]|nr:hypothetical protein [Deltaproteobacteria bacterium]